MKQKTNINKLTYNFNFIYHSSRYSSNNSKPLNMVMTRKHKPRSHLVRLAEFEYDPQEYQALIKLNPVTGCEIIPDANRTCLKVYHSPTNMWRVASAMRLAVRMKLGHGMGQQPLAQTCGNPDCVRLDHLAWRRPDTRSEMARRYRQRRSVKTPQISRDNISPLKQQERQQQLDEFTEWWRDHTQDPDFTIPQWIEIEESYRIIIRTRPGEDPCGDQQQDKT